MGVTIRTEATSPLASVATQEASSTGAKAGIAIGAILGVALLAGLVIICCLHQRMKKWQHLKVPEMSGQPSGLMRLLRGNWGGEMDGSSQPVEIDSRQVVVVPGPPAELEAPHHQPKKATHTR
jgi:hypothetical protein